MEIIEAQWVLPVEPWTVIENGAVAVEDGRIADVGPAAEVRAVTHTQRSALWGPLRYSPVW